MNLHWQFFAQNAHFAVNVLAMLVMLLIAWLYFDAWLARRQGAGNWVWVGYLLLAVSFALHSTQVEQTFIVSSTLNHSTQLTAVISRLFGYTIVIYAQLVSKISAQPHNDGLKLNHQTKPSKAGQGILLATVTVGAIVKFFSPIACLLVAGLYWRRARVGLEKHLQPVAVGFCLIFFSELLALATSWRLSDNVTVFKLTSVFGPIWIVEHIFFASGLIVLGRWVSHYLVRQLQSQLFLIINTAVTVIFLIVTTTFTYLLMRNVTNVSLDNLSVATKVLEIALEAKKSEIMAQTQAVSESSLIATAVASGDHTALVKLTDNFLTDKKANSLIITNTEGQVLLRAEEPERYGDSLSKDTSVKRSVVGTAVSTIEQKEAVGAPKLLIRATSPIRQSGLIVGTASTAVVISNEFIDGIKKTTGLDSTVYAGNIRSSTTLVGLDGKSRLTGIKEESRLVKEKVFDNSETYRGEVKLENAPYLAVYSPLKDIDNQTIGMLFAGKRQATILQTAGQSIEISFFIVIIMLFLSIYPTYRVARYISSQLH